MSMANLCVTLSLLLNLQDKAADSEAERLAFATICEWSLALYAVSYAFPSLLVHTRLDQVTRNTHWGRGKQFTFVRMSWNVPYPFSRICGTSCR